MKRSHFVYPRNDHRRLKGFFIIENNIQIESFNAVIVSSFSNKTKEKKKERKKNTSVQPFSISISARRIFLGDSEQVIDISNIVIHRKNGLLVNVSPLGAARESARSLFNLMAEHGRGVRAACMLRSGRLFMAGCIRGGYKRRLLQTLNSPYINQTPATATAPRE